MMVLYTKVEVLFYMSWNEKGLSEIITEEFLIREHFENDKSIRQIARELNCGKTTVLSYMKKFDLTPQRQRYNQYGRKYQYNDDFFENIDNEEKAYWLGFIMADGYTLHTKKQKRLRIALGLKDENHLNKFLFSIDSNIDIKYDGKNPYVDVNSTKMCDDLSKLGIVPNKSNNEIVPEISENLLSHFIRGLFDGDGSWIITKHSNCETMSFDLLSSKECLYEIQSIMKKSGISFPQVSIFERKGIWCLRCHKREDVLKIIDFMYSEATIYLERKYQKAMDFCAYKSKRLTKQDARNIRALYKTGSYSQRKLGEMFDTSRSNIGCIVNGKTFI